MLWGYLYPAVKTQMIWFPLLSLVAGLLMWAMLSVSLHLFVLASVPSMLLGFAYFFSPVALIRRDYHNTTAQLPVTAGEKFAVLMLYFVVGVPLLLNIPYYLAVALMYVFTPEIWDSLLVYIQVITDEIQMPLWAYVGSLPCVLPLIGITLLSVVNTDRPAISRTVLYFIVSYIVYIVAAMVVSIAASVIMVMNFIHGGGDLADSEAFANIISNEMVPWAVVLCDVIGLLTAAVIYYKIYKRLKKGGF